MYWKHLNSSQKTSPLVTNEMRYMMIYYNQLIIKVLDPIANAEVCPFCGCKEVVIEECAVISSSSWYRAKCCYCEAHGGIGHEPEDAIKNWNNREGGC